MCVKNHMKNKKIHRNKLNQEGEKRGCGLVAKSCLTPFPGL